MKEVHYKPGRRTTLRDIAQATGFSVNTVSHALKDKNDISEQTKEVIRQAAQQMGYIADSIAGSLRSGVTRTIAVILGDICNPHFSLWVREIETAVFKLGYSTLIMNTEEDEKVEQEAIITAIGKRVDGIIICPTQKREENLALLRKSGIPFVYIGRRPDNDVLSDYVVYDDVEGGRIATRNLIDRGHRRILFFNGPCHISSARERLEGYLAAHRDAGIPVDPSLVQEVGIKSGGCRPVLAGLLARQVQFSAIVCFSDIIALEAMAELRQLGGSFERMPVIGFDDILKGFNLPLSMTSVGVDKGSASERAVEILLTRMEEKAKHHKSSGPMQVILQVKLLNRD